MEGNNSIRLSLITILVTSFLLWGIYGGYTGYTYYNQTYWYVEHPTYGSEQAWSLINSNALYKKVSPAYAGNFYGILLWKVQVSREAALQFYNDAIINTVGNPLLTGKDGIDPKTANEINQINQKISQSNTRKEKSELYFLKSKLLYKIGDSLYFKDKNQYSFAVIYYYLSSVESAQRSISELENWDAYTHLGVVLMDLWIDKEKVITYLKNGVSLNPQNSFSYYKLWNAYRAEWKYTEAIQTYLSGISINPHDEMIRVNLSLTYDAIGDRNQAIITLKDAIPYCKEFCNVIYYDLWNDLMAVWKWTNAEYASYFQKAIEEGKKKWEIYRWAYRALGILEYNSGNKDKWLEYLLISLNNENDKPCGTNCFNQNTYEEATYYYLAKIYLEKNDVAKAKKYIYQWLFKFPENKELQELESKVKNHYLDLT